MVEKFMFLVFSGTAFLICLGLVLTAINVEDYLLKGFLLTLAFLLAIGSSGLWITTLGVIFGGY